MLKKLLIWSFWMLGFMGQVQAATVGLKISADSRWVNWGDYILGQDFKIGLENLGHTVFPAYIENFYPSQSAPHDIDIYMHGFVPFNPPIDVAKTKVLYLYYPLETAQTEKFKNLKNVSEPEWLSLQTELWDFDLIAVASPTYQKEISRLGIPTVFVPQFTNPEKFFYEYDEKTAYDILFVGRPGYERLSAKWAIEAGFEVALFGDGWQTKAPASYFKGAYIDNAELHKYYASAKIVLNDTRYDMKKAGFISNRVFDVTASGGFLISDYMPEIEKFYGDAIPMFKTKEELKNLIDYYLAHPEERLRKAKQAQQVTLQYFTNRSAAETVMTAVRSLQTKPDYDKVAIKFPFDQHLNFIGDYWLGIDLEEGLKKNGCKVRNYYFNNGFDKDAFYHEAGSLLYMQFKNNFFEFEDENKAKIMYLYFPTFVPNRNKFKNTPDTFKYNTDASLNNNLDYFDLIATPAKNTLRKLQDLGYNAVFVPQFTNPQKFTYAPQEELKTDLLFVGSTWYERISVTYALEYGYDIAVYGLNWEGKIPEHYIKGSYIDNRNLNKYYSSAKIVLSDHAEDLAEMGLVINRLYDASAAGAFVISEYSPYIEEIFGDTIPLFKTKEEFKQLIDYYLAHPEQRQEKAAAAREITMKHYTNTVVGQTFKQLFHSIGGEK